MPTAEINHTTLYWETYGAGSPLVFVHGGFGGLGTGTGGATPAWVERFGEAFEVILYDRRSSGRSGYPESPHSMEQFAGDIRGVLEHLGHDSAHIWGTSAGGHIALAFGLAFPGACTSLVITDSAPWLSRDGELLSKLKQRIEILETQGPMAAYEARRELGTVGLNLFAGSTPAPSKGDRQARDSRADAIRAQIAKIPRDERVAKYAGELRTYSAYVDWDACARFDELSMPVLVLYGTADSVFPDAPWDALTRDRPNATYHAFDGVEHGLMGPKVLDEIEAFLNGNA
jgi:pimeloyl-ACP methyl ester carboxylesterase